LRLGKGHCLAKGCVEGKKLLWLLERGLNLSGSAGVDFLLSFQPEQMAYNSYYGATDYPVTKVLREPVYAEVRMVGRTDPNIVLVLGDCWATASPKPYSLPQWDLLVNG
ncbi:MAG: zona pellucida domain-containing protein, partial [Aeromonas salmonicida]